MYQYKRNVSRRKVSGKVMYQYKRNVFSRKVSAKVMYLGAMWRWGRVGDILADVLSYRSCLTREREREGGGDSCHTEILNSN